MAAPELERIRAGQCEFRMAEVTQPQFFRVVEVPDL